MGIMITKNLLVIESLFLSVPRIKQQLGERWPEFFVHLLAIQAAMQKGPHPEFSDPLIDALHWGFSSLAEPIFTSILEEHGFDYRFITGAKRRFRCFRPGNVVATGILNRWEQILESSKIITSEVSPDVEVSRSIRL